MIISNFVAYVKQAWKNKPDTSTPLSAPRLLHMEDGIKMTSDAIEKIAEAVVSQIVNDPNKIASMAALYAVNQKIGDVANLPNSAADVVTAITQQNNNYNTLSQNLSKKLLSEQISLITSDGNSVTVNFDNGNGMRLLTISGYVGAVQSGFFAITIPFSSSMVGCVPIFNGASYLLTLKFTVITWTSIRFEIFNTTNESLTAYINNIIAS